MHYPETIQNLINNFTNLPGIGGKTAERLVFYLLKNLDENFLNNFSDNLNKIKKQIKICPTCGNYESNNECNICHDHKRDKSLMCVVAEVQDIYYLDKTHSFNAVYHVLGGLLEAAEGITPDKLNIRNLLERAENNQPREIILGFNPTVEGESTIIYLKKILRDKFPKIKITRLSRGLPMGGDLEYADEITLSSAIKNRSEV
ncbi:recombination protein RecR [Candidatus Kuenenbacteria bacterium RIFCSPHIGHO2_02_FULL_39_13]|uniref:Recombination protein RecR n=1 Tax=Candidatus Kuenenbacteria bacterium RIFCSPHIGHO2_02_FULL_39_13 TaxID=1798561 RepID=A0A1F6FNL7_9BACT|nr:MAG: recombination protein RecR [Candidatus Kuenenbacteria bacterium RIFCSPHIGHO2_02_FULL_39_13]